MTINNDTGFNYVDELSPSGRARVFKQTKEFWDSLTVEERTRAYALYYEAIREKKLSDPNRYMNMQDRDIMREILNVDMSKLKQEIELLL